MRVVPTYATNRWLIADYENDRFLRKVLIKWLLTANGMYSRQGLSPQYSPRDFVQYVVVDVGTGEVALSEL